jgi:hypothetical protein
MSIYTVHEPPLRAAEASPDPERYVFVRDGFYVWAFLLTPLWMIWQRLWLVLLIYFIVTAGLESVLNAIGAGAGPRFLVALLISLLAGIEASTLRRFTLARRGFRQVGIVGGSNTEAAERRFFDALAKAQPGQSGGPHSSSAPPRLPPMPQSPDIIGLFPQPGTPR